MEDLKVFQIKADKYSEALREVDKILKTPQSDLAGKELEQFYTDWKKAVIKRQRAALTLINFLYINNNLKEKK